MDWKERMNRTDLSQSYKDAVRDCIYELDTIMLEEQTKNNPGPELKDLQYNMFY